MFRLTTATCLLLASPLLAHGGQYRGPSDVYPTSPNPSGGGTSRGSGAPNSGGGAAGPTKPTGPTTGAGPIASPRAGARSAGRGRAIGDDLGRWEFWWEFGKDPFLRLRDTIYQKQTHDPGQALWNPRASIAKRDILPPSKADVRAAASQLAATLSSSEHRDTKSACLVALAKIGSERAGFDLGQQFRPFLRRGDQELRETAALAFGIDGNLDASVCQLLHDLIADTPAGRKLSARGSVNQRTRAFAAYGSGLLLRRSRSAGTSLKLTRPLLSVVAQAEHHERNLVVAAIEALALFPQDWRGRAAKTLRQEIVGQLASYYDRNLGVGDQLIQAHVPTAIAGLLSANSRPAAVWRVRFAADLRAGLRGASHKTASKLNHHVAQSCALALGSLCAPWDDDDSSSQSVGKTLIAVHQNHRDQQTRSFATLALARIGGKKAIDYLLRELGHANKAIEQPWLAVALGVVVARQRANAFSDDVHNEVFASVTRALMKQFEAARNPSTVGAIAIALGLTGTPEAADTLRRRLVAHRKRDTIAGYVALSLGLLEDTGAITDLRELREGAANRPFVLLQSVRALGLLGDHSLTEQLSAELQLPGQSLVRLAATAAALGQIGDRRCLPALQALLNNDEVTPLSHAFAAVALGSVCDKAPLPWNAVYATQVNYRAATETLTDGASGILDLL